MFAKRRTDSEISRMKFENTSSGRSGEERAWIPDGIRLLM